MYFKATMVHEMTVNDCHGEVIAKRAFQSYLYRQLGFCLHGEYSIFQFDSSCGKYMLKAGISFHMYISTPPCGDARAFMPIKWKEQRNSHNGRANRGKLRCKIGEGEGSVLAKRHEHDPRMVIMSCSDKIASWNVIGLQGALLSLFIKPVFLKSVVVGKNAYNDREVYEHMARAMFIRHAVVKHKAIPESYRIPAQLMIGIANSSEYERRRRSSKYSLNWWEGEMEKVIKVSTQDRFHSCMCRQDMFIRFRDLILQHELLSKIIRKSSPRFNYTGFESYADIKSLASEYQSVKQILHQHYKNYSLGPFIKMPRQNNFVIK